MQGTRYHSKVQGTGPPTYNTMCVGCTTAIQYKSTHQLWASQRAVENRDCERVRQCCCLQLLQECKLGRCWEGECYGRGSGQVQLLVVEEKRTAHTMALANVSWRRSAELVSGAAAGGGGGWERSCQTVLLLVGVVLGGAASGCSVGGASSRTMLLANYRRVLEQTRQ